MSGNKISCGHIPLHSRYVKAAKIKLSKYFHQILPQERYRSSKWFSASAHKCSNVLSKFCLAEYYTNYMLDFPPFSEVLCSIPKDTIFIEIAPHDILRNMLENSLRETVIHIPLCKHTDKCNTETFLQGIGELYNAGLQPQIANLYEKVQFPVSRATPMISPRIRYVVLYYLQVSYITLCSTISQSLCISCIGSLARMHKCKISQACL